MDPTKITNTASLKLAEERKDQAEKTNSPTIDLTKE
jgi:hypothetical protein